MKRGCRILTERYDVPRHELWDTPESDWVGRRILVTGNGRKTVCRVVASPSGKPHPQPGQLFCGPAVSRKLFAPTGTEGPVQVATVSTLEALWACSDARWALLRAALLLVLAVLALIGLAVQDEWPWWPWVPATTLLRLRSPVFAWMFGERSHDR
jgi:hypothetical protein